MRIAMAGQTYGPENGPGVFTQRLAQRLTAKGHQVIALVPSHGIRAERRTDGAVDIEGIPAITLSPFYPEVRVTPAPFRSARRVLEQFRPDVLHIQDHYPLSRGAARAARRMRIPMVATNHFIPGNMLAHMGILGRASITEKFLWWNLVTLFDRAPVVTTPTETAAAILRPHLRSARVRAISCGVDVDRFRVPAAEERTKARMRWQIGGDDALFVYVGRLDREKRLDVLVEAVARAGDSIRLIVAGRGRQESELRKLAAECSAENRVSFCGFVSDPDLTSLLCAADFFAMPSDVELQSIATLEAMASGLPVLAANARALPELVEEGVNGMLFRASDPVDAAAKIKTLAACRGRWLEMSNASRARAAGHSLDATVAAYEEIYEGIRRQESP